MSKTVWSAYEAASITQGWCCCNWQATHITDEVSAAKKSTLFVARGFEDAIDAIERKKVCAVMISRAEAAKMRPHARLLVVDDIDAALMALARAARVRSGMKVIGVKDGDGQSAVLRMAATVLAKQGQVHVGDHMDASIAMAATHAGTDYGLYAGDIANLRPHVVIDTQSCKIASNGKVFSYGLFEGDAYAKHMLNASNGCQVSASILGQSVSFTLPVRGENAVLYAIATLLAVKLAGGDAAQAAKDFAGLGPQGFGQIETLDMGDPMNPVTLIDESAYASPTAMQAAFKVLALIDPGRGGRRIAVLGDMLDIKGGNAGAHADLALPIRAAGIDLVYTSGSLMKSLHDTLANDIRGAHTKTADEMAQIVPDALVPGDVVLVKGSPENNMRFVVEALRAMPSKAKASGKDTPHYAL